MLKHISILNIRDPSKITGPAVSVKIEVNFVQQLTMSIVHVVTTLAQQHLLHRDKKTM